MSYILFEKSADNRMQKMGMIVFKTFSIPLIAIIFLSIFLLLAH